jgi:hypothetical protein
MFYGFLETVRREGFRSYRTPAWRSPVASPLREHYRKFMRFLPILENAVE